MASSKTTRPSPSQSATLYTPGTMLTGNNGGQWVVTQNSAGVKRWVPACGNIPATRTSPSLIYKFKVGDEVKVINHGTGCGPEEVGLEVTITELGNYGGRPGYKIYQPVGNSAHTNSSTMGHLFMNGFIGEDSFELLGQQPSIQQPITTKPIKMAKATKSITKKTTQEVRQIETSLINKEEVFKMLALAEATGLPLLLVGEPGVAKTKTIIDYAKAWLNKDGKMTEQDFMNKIYVLETDEGTKASEIKGINK
jgi:hypothetical protein